MTGNNILAALVEVARSLMNKMAAKTVQSGMPSKVAARINRSTSAGQAVQDRNGYSITVSIDMSKEAAPMAAMYEWGIQEYRIPKEGETYMAFPKERWPQYQPPPPAPDVFVFTHVTHPAVAATPYIRPSIEENRVEAKRLLGRAFVESLGLRGKTVYTIKVM